MRPGASPEWLSSRKSVVKAVLSPSKVRGTFISGRLAPCSNVSDAWQTAFSSTCSDAVPFAARAPRLRSRTPSQDADVENGLRKPTSVIVDPRSGLWGVDWHGARVLEGLLAVVDPHAHPRHPHPVRASVGSRRQGAGEAVHRGS